MNRRTFLSAAAAFTAAAAPFAAGRSRPNIAVIMADDMGFSDVGCYGSEVSTPNIDALAKRGVRFTQFYNTARCCPTRASLLTGLYSHQAGIGHMTGDWGKPGYRGTLGENTATIAEVLQEAGYGCYVSGKWHVTTPKAPQNLPLQRGFDDFFGTLAGGGNYFYPNQLMRGKEFIKPPEQGFYYTDAISDHAIEFIQTHRKNRPNDPFFLYVPYTAPHWPLHALEKEIARYRAMYREGWDEMRANRHSRQQKARVVSDKWSLSPRDPSVPAWSEAANREWEAERMAVYAAQIDRMDQGIGRIVQNLPEDTLVIFLSDNGSSAENVKQTPPAYRHTPFEVRGGNNPEVMPGPRETFQSCGPSWAQVSNTPFRRYKMDVHEGGIASPFIAAWTGHVKKPGSLCGTVSHVIDLMATCLDAAGVKYPERLGGRSITPTEGRSLVPAIEGRPDAGHQRLFWEHEGNQAVRERNMKLVRARGAAWELYDLERDRTESTNLASRQPETVARLASVYKQWMERANVLPWQEARAPAK